MFGGSQSIFNIVNNNINNVINNCSCPEPQVQPVDPFIGFWDSPNLVTSSSTSLLFSNPNGEFMRIRPGQYVKILNLFFVCTLEWDAEEKLDMGRKRKNRYVLNLLRFFTVATNPTFCIFDLVCIFEIRSQLRVDASSVRFDAVNDSHVEFRTTKQSSDFVFKPSSHLVRIENDLNVCLLLFHVGCFVVQKKNL